MNIYREPMMSQRPEVVEEIAWHASPEGVEQAAQLRTAKRQFVKLMLILIPLLGLTAALLKAEVREPCMAPRLQVVEVFSF
jgi:hypothetical protein